MQSRSINGIDLNLVDVGQGPALLLVHGFPLDHSMWRHQTAHLSQSRRVIAPDLRGFGSTRADDEQVSMRQFAADLHSLLDDLSIDQVDYCGLSMGGYIGWEFVAERPQRTRKLILCDTRSAADTAEAAHGRNAMATRVLEEGCGFLPELMIPKLFAPRHVEEAAECVAETAEVLRSARPLAVAAALRGMATRRDFTAQLAEFKTPSLLICGESDGLTPPAEMREVAAAMPQARFVEIENAGHMAPLEQPELANRLIAEFLVE